MSPLIQGEFPYKEKDPKILGIIFPYRGDLIAWEDLWSWCASYSHVGTYEWASRKSYEKILGPWIVGMEGWIDIRPGSMTYGVGHPLKIGLSTRSKIG